MQVTNVRVSFLREKQPVQFEKSRPEVEFSAVLDEGDNHVSTARQLMLDAAAIVYNGLGIEVPKRVAKALASGAALSNTELVAEALTTEKATADGSPPEDTVAFKAAAGETVEVTPVDKPKSKGGRPKGSKNTAPKKKTAKALRLEAEAAADAAAAAVPGEDTPNISTGGERVNPDDEAVPGDEDEGVTEAQQEAANEKAEAAEAEHAEEQEFSPKDLHTLIMSHVNATPRTLSVANAKAVLGNFKVARAQDLTNEQALEGKSMVEKMVEAAATG